jgi:hypothetical protein
MAEARVESLDALKSLKVAMIKFAEGATLAIGDAESEVNRTLMWLQMEQTSYWQGQLRKRAALVARCKEAVRMKRIFKDSAGREQSAVDEEKALKIALRRLEEAEDKSVAVTKAIKKLEREIPIYKGTVQRFASTVQVDIPLATAHLEKLLTKLQQYVDLSSPVEITSAAASVSTAPPATDQAGSMARAVDEPVDPDPDAEPARPEAAPPSEQQKEPSDANQE